MDMRLTSYVESMERRGNSTVVKVRIKPGSMLPRSVNKIRARAHAAVKAGVVNGVAARAGDVADAIENMSIDEIRSHTEVLRVSGDTVTVRVNQ